MGFLDWFKSKSQTGKAPVSSGREGVPAPPTAPVTQSVPPPLRKPQTVMPKSVKPLNLNTPSRKASPIVPRQVSMRQQSAAQSAPEETGQEGGLIAQKDIHLTLGDVIARIPEEIFGNPSVDRSTPVTLHTRDIASDIAKGRASISLGNLAASNPAVFPDGVGEHAGLRIVLPLSKVVQQLGEFRTRSDQESQEEPESSFDTPFLQEALKDGAHVAPVGEASTGETASTEDAAPSAPDTPAGEEGAGSSQPPPLPKISNPAAQIQGNPAMSGKFATSMMPDVKGRRKPPATVRASVAGGKIKVGGVITSSIRQSPPPPKPAAQDLPVREAAVPSATPRTIKPSSPLIPKPVVEQPPFRQEEPAREESAQDGMPPKIPFQVPPREVPEPAPEPPVVEPVAPAAEAEPPHVEEPEPEPASDVPPAESAPASADTIAVPLASILNNVPDDLLAEDAVSSAEGVEIPLSLDDIAPQLATGRIVMPLARIVEATPESRRGCFVDPDSVEEVALPLKEVLPLIPPDYLRKREDQEEDSGFQEFETPFSLKAREDAARIEEEERAAREEAGESMPEEPSQPSALAEPEESQPAGDPSQGDEGVPEKPALQSPLPDPVSSPGPVRPKPPMPFISKRALRTVEEGAVSGAPKPVGEEAAQAVEPAGQETSLETPSEEVETAAWESVEDTSPDPVPPAPLMPPRSDLTLIPPPSADEEERPEAEGMEAVSEVAGEPSEEPEPEFAETESAPPGEEISEEAAAGSGTASPPSLPTPPSVTMPVPAVPAQEPAVRKLSERAAKPAARSGSLVEMRRQANETLQEIFMVDEEMSAPRVVTLCCKLPNIRNVLISTDDGLKLAGSLSDHYDIDALSALTAHFVSRTSKFTEEIGGGMTESCTLRTSHGLLSIFCSSGMCFFVEHANKDFAPGIRQRFTKITDALAQMYSQNAGH